MRFPRGLLLFALVAAGCAAEPSSPDASPTTTSSAATSTTTSSTSTSSTSTTAVGRALVTLPAVQALIGPTDDTTTDPAATPLTDLAVGHCVDLPGIGLPESVEVDGAQLRDCAEPHGVEIYALVSLDDDPEAPHPGDEAVIEGADRVCLESFPDYVGAEYVDSTLEILHLRPNAAVWEQGDRVVRCGVYDPSLEPLVGSVQGSGR